MKPYKTIIKSRFPHKKRDFIKPTREFKILQRGNITLQDARSFRRIALEAFMDGDFFLIQPFSTR
jgi:hypothetical protein